MSDRPTYIGLRAWDMGFDAHLTVLYTGPLDKEREDYVRQVIYDIGPANFLVFRRGIEIFAGDIPVVTVTPHEGALFLLREMLEQEYGIISPSTFPFNPHISLKLNELNTIHIPKVIKLDKLGLY
jgi:2'-5' RNA ligase